MIDCIHDYPSDNFQPASISESIDSFPSSTVNQQQYSEPFDDPLCLSSNLAVEKPTTTLRSRIAELSQITK